ncbi:hypothetical protein FE374_09740 [Georgenia yuyongxinii]|uniref:Uncharacterized protein n=1 Tax=Georgenia yuyongxinii TaxID=2589797 RepID=A0A5B8C9W8_9MICO|nr:hypothetical protein FE374_09740 [Georgenia yuyongxinii]
MCISLARKFSGAWSAAAGCGGQKWAHHPRHPPGPTRRPSVVFQTRGERWCDPRQPGAPWACTTHVCRVRHARPYIMTEPQECR